MVRNIITLRNIYKTKEVFIQPLKMKNGSRFPFVRGVRTLPDGTTEMILSEADLNSGQLDALIPEDKFIYLTDGTQFDLDNPTQKNEWECIKDSELIVPTRDSKDEHGNFLIDGDKRRYGLAEFYVDVPGEESERSISRKKLINRAWTFIEQDSANGRLTKVKLLGKPMRNSHDSDVMDYLYIRAEKDPKQIIELYTSSDSALRLLFIDAVDKAIVRKAHGLYVYGESALGATDDAVITFLKTPTNKGLLDMIKNEVYPDYSTPVVAKDVIPNIDEEPETNKKKTTK